MKKLVLVFTLFIAAGISAQAQEMKVKTDGQKVKIKGEVGNYEAVANRETEKLDKLVNLTAEQKTAINSINLSLARRSEIVNANNADNKQELLQQLENARTNMYMQKLTDEQAAKYKASLHTK